MRLNPAVCAAFALSLLFPHLALAQPAPPTPAVSVPRLINISGVFQPADGQPPGPVEVVTLSVYAQPEGDLPLWQEMQTVTPDTAGRFTVLLGATHPDGLPPAVFASGEARWMGLRFARAGEVEGPRVRITSVPYALKASDAETLGGRPASAYLLAPTAEDEARRRESAGKEDDAAEAKAEPLVTADLVLPGTVNFLAKYVNADDVGSSGIFEDAVGAVGLGTTTPFDRLHVRFTSTNGTFTGLAMQNMANTAASYSGTLFFDHLGALGQFQGFNNGTHEYRINNIARVSPGGGFDGSINFMLGGASKLRIDNFSGTQIFTPVFISGANGSLVVSSSGSSYAAITAYNTVPGTAAVYADHQSGYGISGVTASGAGVRALATTTGWGLFAEADTGIAVLADGGTGWAGVFDGDVDVTGTLFKSAGAFRIDHPLDPQNKYLSHSFVESPDMKNIYDGVAVLDEAGEAVITLPDWFEALNRDFRYQLTPMGAAFVPYIAEEIAGNQFKVAGGLPGKKVSWLVTGIRHDAFANANRIQVEEPKLDAAAGTYLHPDAFGQPVETGHSTSTAADSKATAKDRAARVQTTKARVRAISQKPARQ